MEELKNMKTMWIELNNRITILEEENRRLAKKVMTESMKTSKEKLIKKYNAFIIVALIMVIYIPLFIMFNPLVVEKYKTATIIYWTFFFLAEAGVDLYLKEKVKDIDIYNSPISLIASQAAHNWKIHKIVVAIGLPVAIGACILFGLLLGGNEYMIYGMIVGGVIGLFIGINQLVKFRNYYRNLQSS